jgi:uncharacterized protein with HEPN domain
MPLTGLEYLLHILEETGFLLNSSRGQEKKAFMRDETLKRAYVRSLETIGEAVEQMPSMLRQKYPAMDWRSIAGMRDRLIHGYFGVDYDIVWDAVKNKIPALDDYIRTILSAEYSKPTHEGSK